MDVVVICSGSWHSMLRRGLVADTRLQRNGASMGVGIYFSPFAHISMDYTGTTTQVNFIVII